MYLKKPLGGSILMICLHKNATGPIIPCHVSFIIMTNDFTKIN